MKTFDAFLKREGGTFLLLYTLFISIQVGRMFGGIPIFVRLVSRNEIANEIHT